MMKRLLAINDERSGRSRWDAARIAVPACALWLSVMACGPASAQATRGPQLDPNQAEKNLESIQLERKRARNATASGRSETPKVRAV
jgi:hypothetical protein